MKLSTAIAATALMLTLGTPAFAQSGPRLADQSLRSSQLIGKSVVGDHGGELCVIEDVLVKPGGGEPTVIVSLQKAGESNRKLIALPLSKVAIEGDKPKITGMSRQDMEKMPAYIYNYGSG